VLFIPAFVVVALSAMTLLDAPPAIRAARTFIRQCGSGLLICVWCISQAPALLTLEIAGYEGRNAFLLVFLILVVQSCDVLQYLWGKLAGRRRIAPTVSPGKTVEGSVGGIASATLLGAMLSPITPFTVAEAASISLALTLLGFLGRPRAVGAKAPARNQGLGNADTRSRRHARPPRFAFPVRPVFLQIVGSAGPADARYLRRRSRDISQPSTNPPARAPLAAYQTAPFASSISGFVNTLDDKWSATTFH
jgi:hypothetical protein